MSDNLVRCSSCQRQLRIPAELVGQLVKCPACGLTFTAVLPSAPAPGGTPTSGTAPQMPPGGSPYGPGGSPYGTPAAPAPESAPLIPPPPSAGLPPWYGSSPQAPMAPSSGQPQYSSAPGHPVYRQTDSNTNTAKQHLLAPAICLLIVGGLGLVGDSISCFRAVSFNPQEFREELKQGGMDANFARRFTELLEQYKGLWIVLELLFLGISVLVLLGAVCMLNQKGYALAITGSIAAMIHLQNCCCLLGIPFGIWAVVVLNNPEVKMAFQGQQSPYGPNYPQPPYSG